MIPFTAALFALRCHVIDMLPTGILFLALAYFFVIRAIFSPAEHTEWTSGSNDSLGLGDSDVFDLLA